MACPRWSRWGRWWSPTRGGEHWSDPPRTPWLFPSLELLKLVPSFYNSLPLCPFHITCRSVELQQATAKGHLEVPPYRPQTLGGVMLLWHLPFFPFHSVESHIVTRLRNVYIMSNLVDPQQVSIRAVSHAYNACSRFSTFSMPWTVPVFVLGNVLCTLTHDHALGSDPVCQTLERRRSGLERIRNGSRLPATHITQMYSHDKQI